MSTQPFLAELKRRNVPRAAAVYIAAVWALAQGIAQLSPFFGTPGWIVRWFVIACVIGFPFWIAFAWYYQITLHGIRRDPEVAIGPSSVRATARKLDYWIIGILAVAVVLLITNQFVLRRDATGHAQVANATAIAAALAKVPAKSIAVLPFENLSADKANAYFVAGMQDLILTKLADIGDLKVIARTSTEDYPSHPGNLKQIAAALDVATILEGSVQKAGNQVLINVQLIDAHTDAHIWARSYTRNLNNIFGVEGEVAQKVADALDAKLTATETAAVGKLPTSNPQAYDDFLRGRYFDNEADKGAWSEYLPQAIAAYEKAVAADPGFALAWSGLSNARIEARYWGVDRSKANLRAANMAAKRALTLAPKSADAHLAMADVERFLYRDFAKAHDQDQQAVALRPNDPDAFDDLSINDAHLGDLAASAVAMRRAIELNPKDSFPEFQLGLFLTIGGHYTNARKPLQKALALNPQNALAYVLLSKVEVLQDGDVKVATSLMNNMPPGTPVNASVAARRIELSLYRRDFAGARKLAQDYAGKFKTGPAAVTLAMSRADVEWLAGNKDAARDLYRAAIELIAKPGMDVGAGDHMALGLAYARLGQAAEAMQENATAEAIDRRSHDVGYIEAERITNLAKIRLAVGDDAGAIDNLSNCLARDDCGLDTSTAQLRIDPTWDPMRRDPRFEALLKKYANASPASAPATSGGVRASP